LDLKPARIGKNLKDNISIQDGLLKGVRVAQFNSNTVRVVLDLRKTHKTKIFYLEDPFRVVVDAFGENYSSKIPKKTKGQKGNGLSLAQQLGLCVKRVVIDAGHGGKDPGAIGPTGLREKDVVLKIAKKVASRLKKDLGCQVILTRNGDRFLPLTQRTAIANAKKADIFVSIHANAAPNRRASGVETYFLNFALDEEAMRVAARENATSTKRIGDLKNILNDIMKNTKVDESSRLAGYVQKEVVKNLRKKYGNVKSKGVKQAPFFVLIGARMPSVLVEVSFISNRKEEKRLKSNRYLDRVAEGIVNGIKSYIRDTKLAYLQ
jgi:N-acetylmuramoyl-L-alanine amidase